MFKPTTNMLLRYSLVLALGLVSLNAQTEAPAALKTAKADLKKAIQSLNDTRTQIAAEKPEITTTFKTIEQELIEKRRKVRIARLSKEDRALTLRQLQSDLSSRRQDANYISGLLKDQALKTSTLAQPGSPSIEVDPQTLAAEVTDPARTLENRLSILDASIDRLEILLGGSTTTGKVADTSGEIHEGTLIAVGPATYFLSADKKSGGDITRSKSGSLPHYYSGDTAGIAKLAKGETVALEFDPTLGNAHAMSEVSGGPLDLFRKGGLWIWPIILLALLALGFGLAKLFQFSRYREPSDAWVTAILSALRTGDSKKALQLANQCQHPVGPVMAKLVSVSENSVDLVEESLYEQLMGVQKHATSMLPVIAVTAATSPLLGLLGTVSGMIATFNLITLFGSGDPKPLAGGISEALITTLFGLIVAIPALIVHAFLARRAQGIVETSERLGLSFVNGLRAK